VFAGEGSELQQRRPHSEQPRFVGRDLRHRAAHQFVERGHGLKVLLARLRDVRECRTTTHTHTQLFPFKKGGIFQ
jgi:hypothetical protein